MRAGATVAVVVVMVACGSDDSSDDTLGRLEVTTATTVAGAVPTDDGDGTTDTAVDPAQAGSGFVSIHVQVPADGVDEAISLDRAAVQSEALDPVSLDATCTPLDGGEGLTVSVVDLRRLGAGSRLVSAALHATGEATPGPHDVTLDVSDADQQTTQYTGTIQVAEGAMSGTFDVADAAGTAAQGSYVCAAEPVATTTTVPVAGGGEEVPGSDAP